MKRKNFEFFSKKSLKNLKFWRNFYLKAEFRADFSKCGRKFALKFTKIEILAKIHAIFVKKSAKNSCRLDLRVNFSLEFYSANFARFTKGLAMKKLLVLAGVVFFVACGGTASNSSSNQTQQNTDIESSVKSAVKDRAAEKIDEYVDSTDENAIVKEVVKAGAKQKANEKIDETFEKAKAKAKGKKSSK